MHLRNRCWSETKADRLRDLAISKACLDLPADTKGKIRHAEENPSYDPK